MPTWTDEQLRADALESTANFRRERLDEPLEDYTRFFNAFVPIFRDMIARLPDLANDDETSQVLHEMIQGRGDRLTAFRYLTAPPISEDDLKTLAETTLSDRALRRDGAQAQRVREIVLHILDSHRFPWMTEGRAASSHEQEQAVIASAALVAAKKVETARRNDSKNVQEERVKQMLRDLHFTEVPCRDIRLLEDAPGAGEFCGESKLGDTRADVIVRLYDRRVLAIECKVSNSATNSFKRLIHEAAGKASKWTRQFGERAVVPAAVLSGVYTPANLMTAQNDGGLALFWAHRLSDLSTFIEGTRVSVRRTRLDEWTQRSA